MIYDATISECKKYRYRLSRVWNKNLPIICFIMLNPSTADDQKDDRTINRIINFAKSWGFGGVVVVNLYGFRSSKPKDLRQQQDPEGPDNRRHVTEVIGEADMVIYAWGNNKREPNWLRNLVENPYCIDISKTGIPKHPLYLKSILQPKPYRVAAFLPT